MIDISVHTPNAPDRLDFLFCFVDRFGVTEMQFGDHLCNFSANMLVKAYSYVMLLRFACKNFRSLRDEQELSLVATSAHDHEESLYVVPTIRDRVVRSAAIYGANASGKTNVIRALNFFAAFIENSFGVAGRNSGVARDRFEFDEGASEPSYFESDFLIDAERFTYGFEVDDVEVIREWLYAFPSGRKVVWFDRRSNSPITFGRSLSGKNRVIETLTKKNSLFLSTAAQNNHDQLSRLFDWFRESFSVLRPATRNPIRTADICFEDEEITASVKSLLQYADLGIVDFRIEEEEMGPRMQRVLRTLMKGIDEHGEEPEIPKTTKKVSLIHQGTSSAKYELDIHEESSGTIAYLSVLGPILRALSEGSLLLIDEVESGLHPSLAKEVIKLFNNPKFNCHGAQIIFTTHDANLLGLDILRRDQIWFTEKDRGGGTSLYPLSDFSVRNDYNVARGYLQGRFGAIPFFNEALLRELERVGCEQKE